MKQAVTKMDPPEMAKKRPIVAKWKKGLSMRKLSNPQLYRVIDALVKKGCAPSEYDGIWTSKCPGHGKKRNISMAIIAMEDKSILLRCSAGCEDKAIMKALRLKMAYILPFPKPKSPKRKQTKKQAGK